MNLHVTRFAHKRDTEPKAVDITWEDLAEQLTEFRIREKPDGELWSPGRFLEKSTRHADNVLDMWLMVLDYDDGVTFSDLRQKWDKMGLEYVVHSSWHHEREKKRGDKIKPPLPRWRAVFPLSKPMLARGWGDFYRDMAEYLSPGHMWDKSCTDPSRMFWLPAAQDDTNTFSEHVKGRTLDPEECPRTKRKPKPKTEELPADQDRLIDALKYVESDDYDTWIKVGMAIHASVGDKGKAIWDQWSQEADNYEEDAIDAKWDTFDRDRDKTVSIRTIYRMAMDGGWDPPLVAVERQPEPPPLTDEDIGLTTAVAPAVRDGDMIPSPTDWKRSLTVKMLKDGSTTLERTPGNLSLLLAHTKDWAGCISFDELAYAVVWKDMPPFIPGMVAPSGQLADEHLVYVQQAARQAWGLTWGLDACAVALNSAARVHAYHPVRQYLDGLQWDGVERLTGWLTTYHGGAETPVPIGRWWAISAVARAYRPGCQVDHVLVLQGNQGCGKSTALRILGGEWYTDSLDSLNDKDSYQSLLGKWIVEIAELDAFRGKASTNIKSFISKVMDSYRPSYGRCQVNRPRQCVFAGTTNEHEYLQDASGARRFWPVAVGPLDYEGLRMDRDQLWAEAVSAFNAEERWWPRGQEEAEALACETESRFAVDPWEELLEEWLIGQMCDVSMGQCLKQLEVETGHQRQYDTKRVGAVLRRLGWRKARTSKGRLWVNSK